MTTMIEQGGNRRIGRLDIAVLCIVGILLASCSGVSLVKPGRDQTVQLSWNPGQNKWMVKQNGGHEEDPTKATIILDKGTGPTKFVVDIAGKPGAFKDPGGLTVWEGSKTKPVGSDQILGPIIDKHGTMTFYDLNEGAPVHIYYRLNLVSGETVDPVIDNRGR